jgi:hypothetical protein
MFARAEINIRFNCCYALDMSCPLLKGPWVEVWMPVGGTTERWLGHEGTNFFNELIYCCVHAERAIRRWAWSEEVGHWECTFEDVLVPGLFCLCSSASWPLWGDHLWSAMFSFCHCVLPYHRPLAKKPAIHKLKTLKL